MNSRLFICALVPFIYATQNLQFNTIIESAHEPIHDAALAARFVINNVNWAAIGSVSANVDVLGYPMTNILGMVDGPLGQGEGVPYILMSHDITGGDVLKNANIALSVTLAQVGYCQLNNLDQQDPRCVRVNFIGTFKNLYVDDPKYAFAKNAMKERHRQIDNWDGFYLGLMDIQFIAVLDYFGGAKIVPVDEYFSVQPSQFYNLYSTTIINRKDGVHKGRFCPEAFTSQYYDVLLKFIIHNAEWGMVTTLTYNEQNYNLTDGLPFNSVVSIADGFMNSGTGVPYVYVSPLEFLVRHVQHDNRISLLLTLAGTRFCKGIDPIADPCPAVVLTGSLTELAEDSIEYNFAQMALFSRHGSMARLPKDHFFKVNMFNINYVQIRFKYCDRLGYFTTEWQLIH